MSALNGFLDLAERKQEEMNSASFFQLLIDDCDPYDHLSALVECSEIVPYDGDLDVAKSVIGADVDYLNEAAFYEEAIMEDYFLENKLFELTEADENEIEEAAEFYMKMESDADWGVEPSPFDDVEVPVLD